MIGGCSVNLLFLMSKITKHFESQKIIHLTTLPERPSVIGYIRHCDTVVH